jgi:predicted N-acyltransferase
MTDDINYRIVDSISKIKKQEWDELFGNIPEGYNFYKTLEESGLNEFSFYYMLICRDRTLLLIAPFFLTDFPVDTIVDESVGSKIRFIRRALPKFCIFKTLFCGSPFGENGIIGINSELKDKTDIIQQLIQGLDRFSREKNVSLIIFKDFMEEQARLLDCLNERGYFKADSFPSVIIDLNFGSLDEYIESLSYSTRKSLRRKLKKAYSKSDITTKVAGSIEDIIDDIYRLYENTYNAGKTKFEKLTKDFFIKISDNSGSKCKYFLYYVNGRLAAFNLCFVHEDTLIDKFIGFDYDIAHEHSLYFVSWCYNVEWCLQNSIKFYQVGQTDYYPKKQLGGKLINLYAFAKHTNILVNHLLKVLSKYLNI